MTTIDTSVKVLESSPADASEQRLDKARATVERAPYTAPCKAALHALLDLMERRGWTQAEAARAIKHGRHKKPLSSAALSQLLAGTYRADPEALCRSIAAAVDHESGRSHFAAAGHAKTRLYHALVDLADVAVLTQRIAVLHGGLLCGKTSAARALVHDYHRAAVVFLTMPYADTYGAFVRRFATVRGIPLKGSLSDLREAILASLDASHLVVIDEFHQPLLSYAHRQAVRVMEFVREINDLRRCGILLVGASAGYAALASDPALDRLAAGLSVVDVCDDALDLRPLADADILAICGTYGLRPDARQIECCRNVVSDHNLARLSDTLRLAAGNAERAGQRFDWSHVAEILAPTLKLAA